jgi:uncharacterized protein
MLRRLVALTVLLFACALAQAQQLAAIPPLTGPVIDTTATLDAATKQRLEARALALQQRKGSQLQVLVIPTTQPEDIAQYATRAYDQYKLGRTGTNDGLLLVVAKDDHRARIEVGYGLEGAIPDAIAIRVITEYMTPKFRAGDFNGGLTDATGELVKLIDGEALPPPMVEQRRPRGGRGGGFLFALFAAFIVAQIARAFLSPVPSVVRGLLGAVAAGGRGMAALVRVGGWHRCPDRFLRRPGRAVPAAAMPATAAGVVSAAAGAGVAVDSAAVGADSAAVAAVAGPVVAA